MAKFELVSSYSLKKVEFSKYSGDFSTFSINYFINNNDFFRVNFSDGAIGTYIYQSGTWTSSHTFGPSFGESHDWLGSGKNLNDYTTAGAWCVSGGSVTNVPTTGNGTLLVFRPTSDRVLQVYITHANPVVFLRNFVNSWGGWYKLTPVAV